MNKAEFEEKVTSSKNYMIASIIVFAVLTLVCVGCYGGYFGSIMNYAMSIIDTLLADEVAGEALVTEYATSHLGLMGVAIVAGIGSFISLFVMICKIIKYSGNKKELKLY